MNRREAIRERRRRQKRRKQITTVLIVAGVALLGAALLIYPSLTPAGEFVQVESVPRPMADGNAMGNPDAPVVIEEFSDFRCPHCADFSEKIAPDIIDAYIATGKVYFVYRSVGELLRSEASAVAAEAAYCAGDQDKFWEYHDLIFANQHIIFTNPQAMADATLEKYLLAFAESLNLDMGEFRSCFNGHTYRNRVQQDEVDARRAGVTGTPSFLINGQLLTGAQPFTAFQQIIEAELAAGGSQ